jgi:hypothetical protein
VRRVKKKQMRHLKLPVDRMRRRLESPKHQPLCRRGTAALETEAAVVVAAVVLEEGGGLLRGGEVDGRGRGVKMVLW